MIDYKWSILDLEADGELITKVHYHVAATDENNTVETEGYWTFLSPKLNIPFKDVLPIDVTQWVEIDSTRDGVNPILTRLKEQLDALQANKAVQAPWVKNTFKPTFKE